MRLLSENGIRYVYEKGAQTDALIFKQTFASDFYLSDYNVYVEYWGLLDTSKKYQRSMKWKMAQYDKNGIKFISIYQNNMKNLDSISRLSSERRWGSISPNHFGKARALCATVAGGTPITQLARFCTKCGRTIQ